MKFVLTRSARKDFKILDINMQNRVWRKVLGLLRNPYPSDMKKLRGEEILRVRVGKYRILYHLEKDTLHIVRIRHRKDVYR